MNFNIYLDDETGQQLNHLAKQAGENRNALVRRAVSESLSRHGKPQWPDEVLAFQGMAKAAAAIRAALKIMGQPIGAYDVLIAVAGLARGLVVVTSNVGEFKRVSGLQVEDWQ